MASATSLSKTGTNDDNVIFGANEDEVARLNIQHKVVYAAMPQLVRAPIDLSKGGLKILDQATGSGIWLRDVRAASGAAESNTWVGTDIEDQYFPQETPPDTSYHHQSMTEPWPSSWNGTFDLVHSRMALPGVGFTPLDTAVHSLINLVKPGGWIQFVEMEWEDWDVGPALQDFYVATRTLIDTVTQGQGVDLRPKVEALLQASGMQNLGCETVSVPFGKTANESVRSLSEQSMYATASGAVQTLLKIGAVSSVKEKKDLEDLPRRVLEEIRERGGEFRLFVLWAQKPVASGD